MAHWYSSFCWTLDLKNGPGFKSGGPQVDATPCWPSANELDLMVPMACQIGSAVVIPKEKKTGKKGMDGWMDEFKDEWMVKTFVTFRPIWPLIHKINEN
jgi:hypothetical protein